MSKIREGRWACPSCGDIVLGRFETCPSCGAPRPQGVRFFLPEGEPYTTDPALLADAASGADWTCDACGGANKGAVNGARVIACVHCGEPRDGDDTDTPVRHLTAVPKTPSEASLLEREALRNAAQERRTTRVAATLAAQRQATKGATWLVGTTLLALVVIALAASWLWTYREAATVVGGTWTHTLSIEAYTRLEEEGFDPPADAHVLRTERREHHKTRVITGYTTQTTTKKVQTGTESYTCGTTDLGNGYFEDKTCTRPTYTDVPVSEEVPVYTWMPVYEDYAFYTIDRWRAHRTATATGGLLDAPVWPTPLLDPGQRQGDTARLGEERVAGRHTLYQIEVLVHTQRRILTVDAGAYEKARSGSAGVSIVRNIWGGRRTLVWTSAAAHP